MILFISQMRFKKTHEVEIDERNNGRKVENSLLLSTSLLVFDCFG